ncbi:hypothetical protein [Streptomyces sp. MST-110588]|uniref:hypothetical protein n=1 Tax=Streptomyces sp. MST-110588 TaxID=2833628 RepID=UPI001F5D6AFD|nr:hypothetical protein [Streptomyces sp. MST-110588]UNO39449.1 hypothetical protein KGS77_07335 [Streptomyces sp. MST-110588]
MSGPVDPRVAYAVAAEPSPGPVPGPTPGPSPSGPGSGGESPGPEPSPSPNPSPTPPAPWGSDPDLGVTTSFLRRRAEACETASETIRKTRGVAGDAGTSLTRAADGWKFTGSLDELQSRWESLNTFIVRRLDQGATNFRLSADAYDANEARTASQFS